MRKDNCRDYIVAAFRFYAQNGEPCIEQIELMQLTAAERFDLNAVSTTMSNLDEEHIKAVRDIYFYNSTANLHKNEISKRVTKFALTNHCNESTVWRLLKSARWICARNRGLNIIL